MKDHETSTMIDHQLGETAPLKFVHYAAVETRPAFWTLELGGGLTVFIPGTPSDFARQLVTQAYLAEVKAGRAAAAAAAAVATPLTTGAEE